MPVRNTREQLQNPTYYKRANIDVGNTQRTAFMFESLEKYNLFLNETDARATGIARMMFDEINSPNYLRSNATDIDWYGTRDTSLITNDLQEYLFNPQLDSFLQTLRSRTINVDKIDLDQQKTIKFTEQEIGVFSFDLASLGLIPVYDFFSPLLKRNVSGNFIKSKPNPTNKKKLIFYHKYTPAIEEHEVEYSTSKGAFFSKILSRSVTKSELIEVDVDKFIFPAREEVIEHDVIRKNRFNKNGKPMYTTTWKKSFIYIPKVEKPLPRIDLIISASFGSKRKAESEMIYSSMSAIAIAEKLSNSGINYRIIACYPLTTNGADTNINTPDETYPFVIVKKEGEVLDKNKIGVLLSDARQFRYQQFRGFIASQYDSGWGDNIGGSYGYIIDDSRMVIKTGDKEYVVSNVKTGTYEMERDPKTNKMVRKKYESENDALIDIRGQGFKINRVKDAYIDYLAQSQDPNDVKASKNRDSKIVFSGALSMAEAQAQYENVVSQITKI